MPGHVHNGVETPVHQRSGRGVGAVPGDVGRVLRHRARLAPAGAGDLVPAPDRLLRDRAGEEDGAAEDQQPHDRKRGDWLPSRHRSKSGRRSCPVSCDHQVVMSS